MSLEDFTELLNQDIDFVSGVLKNVFQKSNNEQQPIFCEESMGIRWKVRLQSKRFGSFEERNPCGF